MQIDVWDPIGRPQELVAALATANFNARLVAQQSVVQTTAELVFLAGDGPDALRTLKALRDDGPNGDVPVILIGLPQGIDEMPKGAAFGADAVFTRSASLDDLVEAAIRLTAQAGTSEAPIHLDSSAPFRLVGQRQPTLQLRRGDGESQPPKTTPPWRPREPTMQLADSGPIPLPQARDTSEERAASTNPQAALSHGGAAFEDPFTLPEQERASLSPWLLELLAAADRRLFPDLSPLPLHFQTTDDSPDALIPTELLASSEIGEELLVGDPIDAFTFIGAPGPAANAYKEPDRTTSASDRPEAEAGKEERPVATRQERSRLSRLDETTAREIRTKAPTSGVGSGIHASPMRPPARIDVTREWKDLELLGRPNPTGVFSGSLAAGQAIALLWRLSERRADALCRFWIGGEAFELTFVEGELRAFVGSVAREVVQTLARQSRIADAPANEELCESALRVAEQSNRVGRYELDRLRRKARERLLGRLLVAEQARFEIQPLAEDERPARLSRVALVAKRMPAALVQATAEALGNDSVRARLGVVTVRLGERRESELVRAELEGELVDHLLRSEGSVLDQVLASAPTAEGLAGTLYALVCAGALRVESASDQTSGGLKRERKAIARLVRSAAELAVEGDYFSILGLAASATAMEVERAHQDRRTELLALDLAMVGLSSLEAARNEALEAVDEAHQVLRRESLRAAYAKTL